MTTTVPVPKDSTQKMQTLSECMNDGRKKGFKEDFKISGGKLKTADGRYGYPPDHVTIRNFYRFEGYSDPADNSILYLIETVDGKKGMVIDTYDTHANGAVSNFIRKVEDIQKTPTARKASWFNSLKRMFSKG